MLERADKGLAETALHLGLDPFEIVRLAVARGDVPARLRFTPSQIELLAVFGGIEHWWPEGRAGQDASTLLRTSLSELLDRDHVGDRWTRLDNLWNDVRGPARTRLRGDIGQLVESGLLLTQATGHGIAVAVDPDKVATVRAVADGRTALADVTDASVVPIG